MIEPLPESNFTHLDVNLVGPLVAETPFSQQFIDYPELYRILHEKISATHDEIQFWARQYPQVCAYVPHDIHIKCFFEENIKNVLLPFVSDLPAPGQNLIYTTPLEKFDPTLCFYHLKNVNDFAPPKHYRLVYIKELGWKGRNYWRKYPRPETSYSYFPELDSAAKNGLIRFYDKETYEFTYHQKSKSNNPAMDKLWINTEEGQKYINDPDEFFLLQDIINIERIFFNRPRNECLEELGFNPKDFE